MLGFLKQESLSARTENGAAAWASSMSACLDLFSTAGALRGASEEELERRFLRAWAENPDLALRIVFFTRDVRGGLGERGAFRVMLKALSRLSPAAVERNLPNIPEYGRCDDLMTLLDTPCEAAMLAFVREGLNRDLEALKQPEGSVSLLAKWLPSMNASSPETVRAAKRVARGLGMNGRTYRKTLSALRRRLDLLENRLRERDYTFDYGKQPSRAMLQYRKAFLRNDGPRYQDFLARVRAGEAALHTGTLYPYDLVGPILDNRTGKEERQSLDAAWQALPDFAGGGNALAVVDGSGSMYWSGSNPKPAAVALSLGLYFAQRNTGAFHGHFITFSQKPQLVEVKGKDLYEQVKYCKRFNECANTNVQAVFDLILRTAVKHRLPQEDLPSALYIISDMEFDACAENADVTAFESACRAFQAKGYQLPQVIFWNVASRALQQPVTRNEQGAALVSGCTPRIFEMVTQGNFSPWNYMLEVLNGPRYRDLRAA